MSSPLNRVYTLTIAALWLIIGLDSGHVPFFPVWIWPLTFGLVALGVAHTTFRPDRHKLRWLTALGCATGSLRGLAFSLDQHRPGPAAVWLLIAMLSAAYYFVRAPQLPERYEDS